MAKQIDLGNVEEQLTKEAPETPVTPVSTELVVKETAGSPALVTQMPGEVEGEFTQRDIATPRLNLVQKVGDLSNLFKPGSWVLNKETLLAEPGAAKGGAVGEPATLHVAVLRLSKRYEEATAGFDINAPMPKSCGSVAEVRALGGYVAEFKSDIAFSEGGPTPFVEMARALVWIERPEGLSPEAEDSFYVELEDGTKGALALFSARGTSYRSFLPPVLFAATIPSVQAAGGLHTRKWKLVAEPTSGPKGTYYRAVPKAAGHSSAALTKFVRENPF